MRHTTEDENIMYILQAVSWSYISFSYLVDKEQQLFHPSQEVGLLSQL